MSRPASVGLGLLAGFLAGFAAWHAGIWAADMVAAGVFATTLLAFYPFPRS